MRWKKLNNYELKRNIFDLFEYARILFNAFYNGKETYSEVDIKTICNLLKSIKEDITSIEEELKFEIIEKEVK